MAEEEGEDEDEGPRGAYAVVHSMPEKPVIACTIFSEEEKPLAHRQWVLEPDGIHIYSAHSENGRPLKVRANPDGTTEIAEPFHDECMETVAPEPIDSIHDQMTKEMESFADDWETRPIKYYAMEGQKEVPTRRLKLTGLWNDEDALDYAAASWYVIEGERLLDEIEEGSGDLENIRKKWDGVTAKPSQQARRIPDFEERP